MKGTRAIREKEPSPLHREGPGRRLAGAAGLSVLMALLLALWNYLQVVLGSSAYREDLPRSLDLLWVAFLAYLPLLAPPILIAAVASRAPGARLAVAGGVAAALLALGVLAPRGPDLFMRTPPSFLDACVAAGAAVACGWGVGRLRRLARSSTRAASRIGIGLRLLAGVPIALLIRAFGLDRAGPEIGRVGAALIGIASLGAGLAIAWALGALIVHAPSLLGRAARSAPGRAVALLAAIGAAAAAGAILPPAAQARSAAPGKPNIVLLVADTLRADRVGVYGSTRARTPALDALAAGGARVKKMYANSSWTGPATASILTGLHPSAHGFTTYRERIRDGAGSLASALREAGYATVGISANPILEERFGFGEGFDRWEEEIEPSRLSRHRAAPIGATLTALRLWSAPEIFPRAEVAVDRALDALEETRGRTPFFLYVQFMDPHDPYAPPPPYDAIYARPGSDPLRMRFGTLPEITKGTQPVGPDDLDRLTAVYDGAATYMDAQIGRLLEEMRKRGWLEGTLVVFTSDHGEEFNEHGGLGHEHTLYEELVRVPLILAGPGVAAGLALEGPVRQIDIAPTLVEAAGLPAPREMEGASIWGSVSRGEPLQPRDVLMEEVYIGIRSPWHSFRALRQGSLKLIGRSFHPRGGDPWRWELYDLEADPAEERDLAEERRADVAALRARIEEWAGRPGAGRGEQAPIDEETQRRLRALGYVH